MKRVRGELGNVKPLRPFQLLPMYRSLFLKDSDPPVADVSKGYFCKGSRAAKTRGQVKRERAELVNRFRVCGSAAGERKRTHANSKPVDELGTLALHVSKFITPRLGVLRRLVSR